MSNTVPFDTLAYAKKLEARGVATEQAEAHAETLAEILETSFITKKDSDAAINNLTQEVGALRGEMKQEINALRGEIKQEINALRGEMKQEINALRGELHSEISILRSEMNMKFAEVKSDVIKWVFGISFAQAALIISVLKFFH